MSLKRILLVALLPLGLAACEQLGFDDPAKVAALREAEGRAVGSGCRYSGKSLEECYEQARRESKAAIFAGWREMDAYMRENNIEVMKSADSAELAPREKPKEKPADTPDTARKPAEGAATEKPAPDGKGKVGQAAPGKPSVT